MKRKVHGKIKSLIITLAVSILAMVLWKYCFEAWIDAVFQGVIKLSLRFRDNYEESLYTEVSKGIINPYMISMYYSGKEYPIAFIALIALLSLVFSTIVMDLDMISDTLNPPDTDKEHDRFSPRSIFIKRLHKRFPVYSKIKFPILMYFEIGMLFAGFSYAYYEVGEAKDIFIQEKIDSFSYHLIIIDPYIDDQKKEELNSSFALIRSKSDYQKLMEEVKQIEVINKIKVTNG
ncbi:MAG: hypothetical protein PQJ59_01610 [Spirochaetales bacterium]|nr:hypothetical protein [Spirochaetales bacterium]